MPVRQFPCGSCGAMLEFSPGAETLKCPYCGAENQIPEDESDIRELDFREYAASVLEEEETVESRTVTCRSCGAESTVDTHITTSHCPFCGSQLMDKAHVHRVLKPKSLLPFKVTKREAHEKFRAWINKLRFAPNKLKRYARQEGAIKGMYIPYWTYDCAATSHYTGERGIDYVTTETYRTKDSSGKTVTRTRQVTKTRWSPAQGVVSNIFDDVLVLASESLPQDKTAKLEPWDLENLVSYQDEFVSGFLAESYQVNVEEGFEQAKEIMDHEIRRTIRSDIGGDRQRIHSVNTRHDDITFKHILLPIWISAYQFKNKVYRFLINGRTGEVQGERPWSIWKIALTVAVVLIVVGVIVLLVRR